MVLGAAYIYHDEGDIPAGSLLVSAHSKDEPSPSQSFGTTQFWASRTYYIEFRPGQNISPEAQICKWRLSGVSPAESAVFLSADPGVITANSR